jgi:DNA topoisomerase-1
MGRNLVIVESPAKAKTINKYLGSGFVVKSSYGHIRDLPTGADGEAEAEDKSKDKKAKKPLSRAAKAKAATPAAKAERAWGNLVRRMGVNPERGWAAHYQVLPGKEKLLKELKEYAEDAETIYLATDLDREGEAIAWHLREAIGGDPKRYQRVTFNEITKPAIQAAFQKPTTLNMDRVNAQQARRFLDRVVGFMVSPLLWAKVARGLSAGRVQSVAVRIVVEREREIRAFIPDEYWEMHASLSGGIRTPTSAVRPAPETTDPSGGEAELRAQVHRYKGEAFKPVSQAQSDEAVARLRKAEFVVKALDDKPSRSNPSAPFITSTLQQAGSTRLGFGVKKTMTLAQRLYEAGHITYMRTDSTNLSAEAVAACRALIGKEFGAKYLPEKPNAYSSKEGAQEAHEAIRPSDVRLRPEDLTADPDEVRLYDLIWRQFVACQMTAAEFDTAVVTIGAADYELRASGRVMRFDGWQRVMPAKKDDVILPKVAVGQKLALAKLDPSQHFTKPPPRYSEASLVKELEKRGIGRPSTYASIIGTIQDRGYALVQNRRFYAAKLGDIVTDRLVENFDDLLDYGFTAAMEEDLDEIAQAKEDWKAVLDRFYSGFHAKLETASDAMRANPPVPTPIACPTCARPMAIRTGRTGVFLSCTGYQLPPKERCTGTLNLVAGDEAVAAGPEHEDEEATAADVAALRAKKRCPVCQTAMDSYLVDEHRKLHICGNNPDCAGVVVEEGHFKLKGYDGPVIECDKCAKPMQLRTGRFGKYFGCTGYPECSNTRKLLRSGQAAPPRVPPIPMPELKCTKSEAYFVLRDGAAGIFLAAHDYPKSRETRAPQVADLQRHRAELADKYLHLAAAPAKDPEGNPTLVRYARKTAEHYVSSEKDGEATGWTAHFVDGKWVAKRGEAGDAKPAAAKRTVKK